MRPISLARQVLVVLLVFGASASHAAPSITSPVVAALPAPNEYSFAIGGTGFSNANSTTSYVEFVGPYSQRFYKSDTVRVDWSDTQLLVRKVPKFAAVQSLLRVVVNGVASPTTPIAYFYDSFDVPGGTNNGSPLAIAVSDSPTSSTSKTKLWINQEFHTKFWSLDPSYSAATALPAPTNPNIFTWTTMDSNGVVNSATAVPFSAGGEDAQIGPDGSVWFTESGVYGYNSPQVWTPANHSRIVRYDASGTSRLVYNIPGNLNQVWGLAFDPQSPRLWFGSEARVPRQGEVWPPNEFRARIVSFRPRTTANADDPGIAPIEGFSFPTVDLTCVPGTPPAYGTCNSPSVDISSRSCVTADDCVLAEEICPDGGTNDTEADDDCYQEYLLPTTTGSVAHLLLAQSGNDRYVYYTGFTGRRGPFAPPLPQPPARRPNVARLGRLDPKDNSAFAQVKEFPLADVPWPGLDCVSANKTDIRCMAYNYGTHPWQILEAPNGDIVITEHFTRLGRFDTSVSNVDACLQVDPMTGANPCIQELEVPVANPAVQFVHSIAYDSLDNLWFTLGSNAPDLSPSIGYLEPGWTTFKTLPALHLISPLIESPTPFPNACVPASGGLIGLHATGIAKDPNSDDLWFGDYCRKRVGRLRDAFSPYTIDWTLQAGADDAYEHDMHTASPSKPKTTATQLQLDKNLDGSVAGIKSMVALRLTSPGVVNDDAVTSNLSMPIVQIGSTRDITLQVWAGVPNDAPFNANVFHDIGARIKIASVVVDLTIDPSTTSIDLDEAIAPLMESAKRHPDWNHGAANVLPIYVSRLDTLSFTLNVKAVEHSSPEQTKLTGLHSGS